MCFKAGVYSWALWTKKCVFTLHSYRYQLPTPANTLSALAAQVYFSIKS